MSSPGARFRAALAAGPTAIPGAFDPLAGRLIARRGFRAAYLSGAAFSAGQLALPDVGLFTLSELAEETRRLVRAAEIPILVDADTGFGEALSVERTVRELEAAGAAALQLEDQVLPKRCGHLSGKSLVDANVMCAKLRAAAAARRDPSFMIVARTDARDVESLDAAIARAAAYVAAGADAIFPEALATREEFAAFRAAIPVPLIANMTEFGRTTSLTMRDFAQLRYDGVLFPVTLLRAAMKAADEMLTAILEHGTVHARLDRMQTHAQLYELLDYQDYEARDRDYFGNSSQ
ncbi:MAG: methylisocitrate lyase [Pirellulales bacterium]